MVTLFVAGAALMTLLVSATLYLAHRMAESIERAADTLATAIRATTAEPPKPEPADTDAWVKSQWDRLKNAPEPERPHTTPNSTSAWWIR